MWDDAGIDRVVRAALKQSSLMESDQDQQLSSSRAYRSSSSHAYRSSSSYPSDYSGFSSDGLHYDLGKYDQEIKVRSDSLPV